MALSTFIDQSQVNPASDGLDYVRLRRAIDAVLRAQSCHADIKHAQDACAALGELRRTVRRQSTARATNESALLATAGMFYARATSIGGANGECGSIQIKGQSLTPAQPADHDILIEIRNRALAHVQCARQINNVLWHDVHLMVIDMGESGWQTAAVSKRILFDLLTFERLNRQLTVAAGLLSNV